MTTQLVFIAQKCVNIPLALLWEDKHLTQRVNIPLALLWEDKHLLMDTLASALL